MAIPPTSGPFRFHTSTPMAVDPLASSVPPGGNGWEEALSGLRQTIRHARRELEESRVQVHNMDTLEPPQTKPPYTDRYIILVSHVTISVCMYNMPKYLCNSICKTNLNAIYKPTINQCIKYYMFSSYRASSPDCSSITTLSQNSTLHRPDLSTNSLPS